jgi:predicted GNAT superfamily acetyltransferase
VGFLMAVAGIRGQQIFLHSHMTAVFPEYQNRGIGRQLKLAQRDDALARGHCAGGMDLRSAGDSQRLF